MTKSLSLRLWLIALMMVFSAIISTSVQALEQPDKLVKFRLLPEMGQVKGGETIWIGIEQSIFPEWHTYWKNPGDSGTETRIEWAAPDGFQFGKVKWPIPHRLPFGPLLNYGYEHHVILLQQLTLPEEIPPGTITLKADIEVLVCKEECIPEFGTYEMTLNGPNAGEEDNREYLASAREKLPIPADWKGEFTENEDQFVLNVQSDGLSELKDQNLYFFPETWGLVQNVAKQNISFENNILTITQRRDTRPIDALETIQGVLAFDDEMGQRQGYALEATNIRFIDETIAASEETAAKSSVPASTENLESPSFAYALILAIMGGIILNLMPCVFPVLSIKALSLVKIAEKSSALARLHGLSYAAGVIISFLAIAGLLIALQAGGAEIGWGFQLQNPIVVLLLAYLLFIIGLNLTGFFEITLGRAQNLGTSLTQGQGLHNSFLTGVLATLVATPCTAPFMGVAIGYAITQPAIISLTVFATLGLGLALPYLALSFVPALQKSLPKPGPWMDVFKEFLSFPMFASAAWLIWVLSQQAGPISVLGGLMGMVFIAFGIWLLQHRPANGTARRLVTILATLSLLAALGFLPMSKSTMGSTQSQTENTAANEGKFGEKFTPEILQEKLAGSNPVFVEMTAAWCITCKVNHATSLNINSTKKLFSDNNVDYLVGDWTNQDPQITKYLNSYGRNGVPIYVFYGAPDPKNGKRPEPEVLPQILTPGIVADTINMGKTKL